MASARADDSGGRLSTMRAKLMGLFAKLILGLLRTDRETYCEEVVEGHRLQWEHGALGGLKAAHARSSRGQGNLVNLMIGVMIAGIVALNVFIPVINDAESNANLSSTEATIVGLLGLFAALLLLVSMASPMMGRL